MAGAGTISQYEGASYTLEPALAQDLWLVVQMRI